MSERCREKDGCKSLSISKSKSDEVEKPEKQNVQAEEMVSEWGKEGQAQTEGHGKC